MSKKARSSGGGKHWVGHGWRLRFAAVAHQGLRGCALVSGDQGCKWTVAATGLAPRWVAAGGHGWRLRFVAAAHQGLRGCALVSADQGCKRTVAATGLAPRWFGGGGHGRPPPVDGATQ